MIPEAARKIVRAAAIAMFILSAVLSVFAQDTGSITGSTSADNESPSRIQPPSTPERRAKFSRKQFSKYANASRKNAAKRNNLLFNRDVALLPSGEVTITSAGNLRLSELEPDYERELNFFAERKVFLLPDEFMQARFIEQTLKPQFANVDSHALLEGLLLKDQSFKKTLMESFNVPAGEADSVISKARDILKNLK